MGDECMLEILELLPVCTTVLAWRLAKRFEFLRIFSAATTRSRISGGGELYRSLGRRSFFINKESGDKTV